MLAIVTVSFYLRKLIGQKVWRFVHFSSFGSFVAALTHGIAAGTDSGNPAALALYGATGAVVMALLFARVALVGDTGRPARQPVPTPPVPPA
jgi:sulfoxide reductase heme-binding subunit YedZ